jgi:hypothetical protein
MQNDTNIHVLQPPNESVLSKKQQERGAFKHCIQ